MASSFGGTVKLSGESDYKKAIKDITTNLKQMSSELKLVTTQFQNDERAVSSTRQEYSNINEKVKEQREGVKVLKETLAKLTDEYGENNNKVKELKTQLNNAETKLSDMEKQTNKSTSELNDMKKSEDSVGNSAVKMGDLIKANVISDAIISGIKKLGNMMATCAKQIGSAAVQLGKDAVASYAEYEQLVGGVETLFKDSSGAVKNYANNAYKTAGLSANQYMETVTGFSASLLQSLGGNTQKSAEVANIAIIDMSDNANKMGTDMSMIQSAYQGFAKQNYTMLDNLKLGYGGTKTEMQRLLKDAQKLTGVKYNINNLNDVYQAIHVIQGQLDITGTTAKEASTTISGSINSMKSAWKNLVTGVADDKADFDTLIGNFVESVGTAMQNLLPRIGVAIGGIGKLAKKMPQLFVEQIPKLVEAGKNILQGIIDGIKTTIPTLIPVVKNLLQTITTFISENLTSIIETGIEIIGSLVDGIIESLPELVPVAVQTIITLTESLLDNVDKIIDTAIELISVLTDAWMNSLPIFIDKAPELINKFVQAIANNLPKIVVAGVQIMLKLIEGWISQIPNIISKIPELIGSIAEGFGTYWNNIVDIGKNLIEGIGQGVVNAKDWLIGKVRELCGNCVDAIKNFFGIQSPSKLMRDEVGKYLAEGIGIGFTKEMKNVTGQMQNSIPTQFDINANSNISEPSNLGKIDTLINILNNYFPKLILESNKSLILDTGALVAATAGQYDIQLGDIQAKARRGN